MRQNARLAEVVSTDDQGMTEHSEEKMSGTGKEAEQEMFPTGQRMVSPHLSEPHVPQTNQSCLLCAGSDIRDNLPIACSGNYRLTQPNN